MFPLYLDNVQDRAGRVDLNDLSLYSLDQCRGPADNASALPFKVVSYGVEENVCSATNILLHWGLDLVGRWRTG